MPYMKELPKWVKAGTKPPEQKLSIDGWLPGDKPPADWLNWIANKTYEALQELQQNAIHVEQKGVANGVASLGADGKVPAAQLNVQAPADATTTVKGIVKLNSATNSIDELTAATPKAVKAAYDLANSKSSFSGSYTDLTSKPTIPSSASQMSVSDAGNYYTSTNTEGALQEIGSMLNSMRGDLITSVNNILGA